MPEESGSPEEQRSESAARADDNGETQQNGETAKEATRNEKIAGRVLVSIGLIACVAAGWIIAGDPTDTSRDAWGWLTLLLGAAFSLFAAYGTPFIGVWGDDLGKRLPDLPATLMEALKPLGWWFVRGGMLALVLIVLLGVLIEPPNPTSTSSLEEGEIVVYSAFSESPSDPRRILIEQWNQAHPESKVRVEDIRPEQVHDRSVNDAAPAGQHAADVYVLDDVWMPEFIQNGYIRALDAKRRVSRDEEYLSNVMDTCHDVYGRRSGTWCLPLNADAGMLFERTGLDAPDPANWDGYLGDAALQAFAKVKAESDGASGRPVAASATQFTNADILVINTLEAIWAAGGQVVNRDGRLVLNADGSAVQFDDRAVDGMRKLARAYGSREITTAGSPTDNENQSTTAFGKGQALYMRNWPVANDVLRNPRSGGTVPFRLISAPWDSVLGGQNLAIAEHTDHPKAAQAFVEFMASPSSQLLLFEIGGFAPARPESYANASAVSRPYADQLRAAVERARPRPVTPCYTRFSAAFSTGITRAMRNGGNVEPDLPRILADAAQCR